MNPFIQLKTIVVVSVLLAWAGIAGAQAFPRLKPLPPKKGELIPRVSALKGQYNNRGAIFVLPFQGKCSCGYRTQGVALG